MNLFIICYCKWLHGCWLLHTILFEYNRASTFVVVWSPWKMAWKTSSLLKIHLHSAWQLLLHKFNFAWLYLVCACKCKSFFSGQLALNWNSFQEVFTKLIEIFANFIILKLNFRFPRNELEILIWKKRKGHSTKTRSAFMNWEFFSMKNAHLFHSRKRTFISSNFHKYRP